jgi:hypothetical protein
MPNNIRVDVGNAIGSWREKDLHGVRVQRKRVIGTVERYPDGAASRT